MLVFAPGMDNLRKKPTFHDNSVVSPQSDIWETSAEIPYWWFTTTQISVLSASDWWKYVSFIIVIKFQSR